MKHCLLITAYKDAELLNRFISRVPEDWGIFVHLDYKCSINPLDINKKATTIKKFKVYWGSIEHVKAYLYLMRIAVENNYDYYHLVTGQDYFATNPLEFDSILGNDGKNYMDFFTLPRKGWRGGDFSVYKIKTFSSFGDIRYGVIHKLDRIFTLTQIKVKKLDKPPQKWKLYGGSVYCSLHHSFIRWLLNNDITNELLRCLNNTTCGEEVFFQTLLMASPYADKLCNTHYRYIDWATWCPPKILTIEDMNSIIHNKYLFCRKIGKNSLDLCSGLDNHFHL